MEIIYFLISLTVIVTGVTTSYVTDNEKTDGIDLRCSFRWSGEGSEIRRLTVHSWDVSCHFPAGASLTLYGADRDCLTCSLSTHEQVMVNGKRCTATVLTARSGSSRSTLDTTIDTMTTTTTESYRSESYSTESYSTASRLQGTVTMPRWTVGLLATLAVSVLVMFVLIVVLLLRFRRQRAYICCKPRTSQGVSIESMIIYPVPTLQL